ncbi:hypothetical protein BX666DRAFT_2154039 [Dichotomocladium elegans]|nr:hypothetical protein BX666DRAFT_2154039 [Dichotomocladium elegans]
MAAQIASSVDSPIPSFTNEMNTSSCKRTSLYHTCRAVLNGLAAIPGFDEYLSMEPIMPVMTAAKEDGIAAFTTIKSTSMTSDAAAAAAAVSNDPLNKLWSICREGSSLCLLYNTLKNTAPIKIGEMSKAKPKACVYHFIVACRDHLGMPEDHLFTVSDLFQDNTNGFVKVVNTVSHILGLLETNGMISIQPDLRHCSDPPKNTRDMIVFELIETERRYVHDLERLQRYMREAQTQQLLPPDTLHQLFGNLNALVDFQRRFLIYAEDYADKPPEEQRFGNLFIRLEDAFSVYEPFCANFKTAQDLVFQEAQKLQQLGTLTNPTYELPSMLIKPVQRVCKYPLIMYELIKATPCTWAYYEEMKFGLMAIQRVATKVNETKRLQENQLLVEDLKTRLNDHRGCDIPTFGLLLLQERFSLNRNNIDYDVQLYLFEKTLLVCTELNDSSSSSTGKKSGVKSSKKKKTKETTRLFMRGKITISQIVQVTDASHQGTFSLSIFWSERDPRSNSFSITSCTVKFRNTEQLQQWQEVLNRLIKTEKRLSRESRAIAEALVQKHQPELSLDPSTFTCNSFAATASSSFNFDEQLTADDLDHSSNDEEDHGFSLGRRSRSQNAQLQGQQQKLHLLEHRSKSELVLPLAGEYDGKQHNAPAAASMALLQDMFSAAAGEDSPLSHPSSPLTGSNPSTPSASNRASSCSTGLGQFWWQRKELPLSVDEDADDFRSAVTASLMKAQHSIDDECSSIISRVLCTSDVKHMGEGRCDKLSEVVSSVISGHSNRSDNADASENAAVTARIRYHNELHTAEIPLDIGYHDLIRRIASKLKLTSSQIECGSIGVKYRDEDGDLITIGSDDDIQVAFEARSATNTIDFFVITFPPPT